jgi:hypothetical protein
MKASNDYHLMAVLLLMHFQVVVFSQSLGEIDSIHWRCNYKLQWSDFKGMPPAETSWNAVCGSHIKAKGYRDGKLPNFRVTNYFVRSESWSKDTTSISLLEHERLHFDISEIFARKIRHAVDSLRRKGEANVKAYSKVIDSWLVVWDAWTETYDEETSHGLRSSRHAEWVIKIRKELNVLEKYATKCPPTTGIP